MDQDSAFMSSLMTYLLAKFDIKVRTVAPYNHQSLQVNMASSPYPQFLQNILPIWVRSGQNI